MADARRKRPKGILRLRPHKEIKMEAKPDKHGVVVLTAKLHIANPSSEHSLAFKIKTTEPERYLVRPNQGVIETASYAEVTIGVPNDQAQYLVSQVREAAEAGVPYVNEDRFLVQSLILPPEAVERIREGNASAAAEQLSKVWESSAHGSFFNEKLKVAFAPALMSSDGVEVGDVVPASRREAAEDVAAAKAGGGTGSGGAVAAAGSAAGKEGGSGSHGSTSAGASSTGSAGSGSGGRSNDRASAEAGGGGGGAGAGGGGGGGGGGAPTGAYGVSAGGAGGAGAGAGGAGAAGVAGGVEGGASGAEGGEGAGGAAATFKQLSDLRAQYNELMTYTINLDADKMRVTAEYQGKAKELEAARATIASLKEELAAGGGKRGGLRRRGDKGDGGDGDSDGKAGTAAGKGKSKDGAGAGAAGGEAEEAGGFALWHLVLVGLVMFLVGRLINS